MILMYVSLSMCSVKVLRRNYALQAVQHFLLSFGCSNKKQNHYTQGLTLTLAWVLSITSSRSSRNIGEKSVILWLSTNNRSIPLSNRERSLKGAGNPNQDRKWTGYTVYIIVSKKIGMTKKVIHFNGGCPLFCNVM